jgi:3-phenylpropionate/trans-cinnamate dioxygenase ferredoxin reductase subunit
MSNYKYLIVGGGMVAAAAVHGIREVDAEGSIGIVSSEADPPYNRPPLSKGLWKGDEFDSVWDDVSDLGVTLTLETTIKTIDPENKRVIDDKGRSYSYDKLLLATGAVPSAARRSSTTARWPTTATSAP